MKKKNKKLNFNPINEIDFLEGKFIIKYKRPSKKWEADGLCLHPKKFSNKTGKIFLDPKLKERRFLICVIDELIHANVWSLDNECVEIMSDSIGDFLWKLGFRLNNNK